MKTRIVLALLFGWSSSVFAAPPAETEVAILGAGWAGLSAAVEFQENQFKDFVILEASDEAGGLAKSEPSSNGKFHADHGPQFILSHYDRTLELMRWAGIQNGLVEITPYSSSTFGGDDEYLTVDNSDKWSLYYAETKGGYKLMYPNDALNVADAISDHAREMRQAERDRGRKLSPARMDDWDLFDTETVNDWGRRNYGLWPTQTMLKPFYDGIFFQPLREISKSSIMWVLQNYSRKDKWYTARDGMQEFTDAIAKKLAKNIFYSSPVSKVKKRKDGKFEVLYSRPDGSHSATLVAQKVIFALPPRIAAKLLDASVPLTPSQKEVLKTKSYSTMVVNVEVDQKYTQGLKILQYQGKSVSVVYSLSSAAQKNRPLAAFSVETGKIGKSLSGKQVFGGHMTDQSAQALWNEPDSKIIAMVHAQLEKIFDLGKGGLAAWSPKTEVFRIPDATTSMDVGQATLLKEFWIEQEDPAHTQKSGLLFATGVSFPTVEASAVSGQRVAITLLKP
ncbi:FAD-dependent oxidoreductase [bacterium]|nr:FAD-dependent oxidoreductase [bacterium]